MPDMERPEALAALSGRVDIGLRNSANSTQNGQLDQAQLAVIRKNALEERNGGTDRIPTKAGICCAVRLIPELIEALHQAEAAARKAGLLS